MDELEKKAQEIENSIKEAKNESTEVKKELQEVKKSMEDNNADTEKKFNNIDESLKEMKKAMEQKEEKKEQTFDQAVKGILDSAEFKDALTSLKEGKSSRFVTEVKTSTASVIGDVNRTIQDTTIYGPTFAALAFLNRLPKYTIGQDKNRILYCNASFTDNTDYVGEGQAVANANEGEVTEKYREIAKVGSKLKFTAETMTDANFFLNWLRNQSVLAIRAKIDTFIWNGDGADGSKPKHIYGIKGAATAFDAVAAGHEGKIENADIYALLLACKSQIEIATNGAYTPNVVFVHPAEYTRMRNLRDANGNQISIADVKAFLGCEVVPTTRLAAGEALVVDINAIQLHEKLGFELEVERIASSDEYAMHLRWRGNIVIPDEAKKAVIYVANIDTAIGAITKA